MPASLVASLVFSGVYAALATAAGPLVATIVAGVAAAGVGALIGQAINPKTTGNQLQARNMSVRNPTQAANIVYGETRLGGCITYVGSYPPDNRYPYYRDEFLNVVITYACHEVDSFTGHWSDATFLTVDSNGRPSNQGGLWYTHMYIDTRTGTASQTAFSVLQGFSAGDWTADHRQLGWACAYYRLAHYPDLWPSQLPNLSAKIKGKKVYDFRTGTTAWSDNPALCVADFLMDTTYGFKVPLARIDADSVIAAANACDELVTLKAGGTEKRYTCNGVVSTEETREDILIALLASMAGTAKLTGGKWFIHAGVYEAPVLEFDESDMVGSNPISISTKRSRRDRFNSVKGTYIRAAANYTPQEYPPYVSTAYLAEDSGVQEWEELNLAFTNSPSMAQRIAKIKLERSRRQVNCTVITKLKGLRAVPGGTVMLTYERAGWSQQPFEVEDLQLNVSDNGEMSVTLRLQQIDANVYEWAEGSDETTAPPLPSTTLSDPFSEVSAPGVPSFSEDVYESLGGVRSKMTVSWAPSDDINVQAGGQYQLEYRRYRTPQNLLLWSEALDNSKWYKEATQVSADLLNSPLDGALSVDKVVETNTTDVHYVAQGNSFTGDTEYTLVAFVKAAERQRVLMYMNTGLMPPSGAGAIFDVRSGLFEDWTAGAAAEASMEDYPDDWWRCQVTFTPPATVTSATAAIGLYLVSSGRTTSYPGSAGNGLYVGNVQLLQGQAWTEYTKTTSITATGSGAALDWTVFPNIRGTTFELLDLQTATEYEFRVKAINMFDRSSPYAYATRTVQGLLQEPAEVRSFSVRAINGLAHLSWALHADADVRVGGSIEVRHSSVDSLAATSWSDSVLIDRYAGALVYGVGPLVQGHYMAKARDSSGRYSNSFAAFFASEGMATGFTTVASVVAHPLFPGSLVNVTWVSSMQLQLTNPASWTTGQYYFPGSGPYYVDMTSAAVRRFEADLTLVRFDTGDTIGARGLVSAWSSVGGGDVSDGDVALYTQVTSTDPSSNVWSEWTPFRVADFNCRAARFMVDFTAVQPTHNLALTELAVHIKRAT